MYSHIHSVQSLSHGQLFVTPWTAACQVSLCFTNSQLPELVQTHVHWVGDAFQPSHPLSSPSPPAFNLSQHRGLFQWVSSLHQMAKVLEFQQTNTIWLYLCEVPRKVKFIESESTLVDARSWRMGGWGGKGDQGLKCLMWAEFQFRKVKNSWDGCQGELHNNVNVLSTTELCS